MLSSLFFFFWYIVSKESNFLFYFFYFYFYSYLLEANYLQYCSGFCHTLTWISHGFTCVPHPGPPSRLPHHPIKDLVFLFCLLIFYVILATHEEMPSTTVHAISESLLMLFQPWKPGSAEAWVRARSHSLPFWGLGIPIALSLPHGCVSARPSCACSRRWCPDAMFLTSSSAQSPTWTRSVQLKNSGSVGLASIVSPFFLTTVTPS